MIGLDVAWVVLGALCAFLLSKRLIPVLLLIAYRYKLYDQPDQDRKIHHLAIPTLGGIAIYLSFIVPFSFVLSEISLVESFSFRGFGNFVAASMILFGIGVKDDTIGLSPRYKLIGQILAIGIMVIIPGFHIQSMGGLFGINEISLLPSYLLTFFAMVVLINAFNLLDGVDGLAGSVGVLTSLLFGAWFWQAGMPHMTALSLILTGSILGFLRYNYSPARIFMGDTGSLMIGFYLAIQAVVFVNTGLANETIAFWQPAMPVIAMAILVLPLYDTLRVFILRIARKKSPFDPDRSHLHHVLLDAGLNHRKIMGVLCSINIFFVVVAVLLSRFVGVTALFFSMFGVAMLILPTNQWKTRLIHRLVPKSELYIHPYPTKNELIIQPEQILSRDNQPTLLQQDLPEGNWSAQIELRLDPDSRTMDDVPFAADAEHYSMGRAHSTSSTGKERAGKRRADHYHDEGGTEEKLANWNRRNRELV